MEFGTMTPALESGESAGLEPNRNFGTVVSVDGDQLVTVGDSGVTHTYTMKLHADITGRGTGHKLSDITVGSRVRIVEQPDDVRIATAVESLRTPGSAIE
jgi:hypothetical protein